MAISGSESNFELVRMWLNDCTQDELRTLRAIINGKLGKRKIAPEQQAKMQAARAARALPTTPKEEG